MKRIDPLLRTQPWKILAVFQPIERVISRIEIDGEVEEENGMIVFQDHDRNGWYDLPEAVDGVIEFHKLAQTKYGLPADTEGLQTLAEKLRNGTPLFESDLDRAKASIASCKAQALKLRVSQAADLVQTVRVWMRIERLKAA